jgi:hypothetical protein
MKKLVSPGKSLKIIVGLVLLFLFLGCKKEDPCKNVVQGDFVLVE